MRTRKEFESQEHRTLAPFAMRSSDSAGREFTEPLHAVRTCYQRDRDRIVHCEAFRKLEYKTQVFVILEGDYYRTRLTHTIEVAQIARTIGRALQLNEDLIEAIALAHDLGHPPFGHAGEFALNKIMAEAHLGNFNHNYHSFQIVTSLEKRYPEFPGLNLTEEVIIGILKHETDYDKKSSVAKYKNKGPTLEAKVVDIADSLTYLSHDIDDGLTSGCITEEDLMENPLWQTSFETVKKHVKGSDRRMLKYQIVRSLIELQMRDLLEHSNRSLEDHNFRSVQEVKRFHLRNPRVNVIAFSPKMKKDRDNLQKLLYKKFYRHYRVERMTEKARRIITDIFNVYQSNPEQLPYDIYKRDKAYTKKDKYQIICNYIARMTDRFALDEHAKLFDPYKKV